MFTQTRSIVALTAVLIASPFASADMKKEMSKLIPPVAKADEGARKPSLGFWAGYGSTESRRESTTFGADYMFQPVIPFSFGGEVLGTVIHQNDANSEDGTLTRTRLLAKAAYNFGGDIPVLSQTYVAFGLGPVFDNERNSLNVAVGFVPSIGMDFPLWNSGWTAGANVSYMFLTKGDQTFAANGVMKYWF